ncbi:MAG: DUF4339 domain-containing protein [Planctomycetales bacterium]
MSYLGPCMTNQIATSSHWYYQQERETIGPFSFEQLLDLVYQGTLTPETLIKSRQSNHWERARILPVQWPGEAESEEEYLYNQLNWYLKSGSDVIGPKTLRDLAEMLVKGRLKPTDQLRYGLEGAWQPSEGMHDLLVHVTNFVATKKKNSAPGGASSGAAGAPDKTTVTVSISSTPSFLEPIKNFCGGFFIVATDLFFRIVAVPWWILKKTWMVLVVIGLWIGINYAMVFWQPPAFNREILTHLQASIDATEQMMSKKDLKPEEWQAFSEVQLQKAERLRKQLVNSSNAGTQAQQHLLWVMRDYLIPIWQAPAPPKEIPDRATMVRHMEQAEFKLDSSQIH